MSNDAADEAYLSRIHGVATFTWPYMVGKHQLFAVITSELSISMERIWRFSLRIQQLWDALPAAARFHYFKALLIEEVQSTNNIEGVHSTKKEIDLAIDAVRSSAAATRRFNELVRSYLALSVDEPPTFPSSLRELREIYDLYFADEIDESDQPDGKYFRANPVHVTTGIKVVHQGTPKEQDIEANLNLMLASAHKGNAPELLSAVTEHFMFEHTHPFYDGNGRMGRYLLGLRLAHFLPAPIAVSLSREVMRHKSRYYKAFTETEHPLNRAEATYFASTMLDFIEEAAVNLFDSLHAREAKLNLLGAVVKEMPEELSQPFYLLGQIHLFGSAEDATLGIIAEFLGIAKQTARKRMLLLEEEGLVRTLKSKPLIFGLTDKAIEAFNPQL